MHIVISTASCKGCSLFPIGRGWSLSISPRKVLHFSSALQLVDIISDSVSKISPGLECKGPFGTSSEQHMSWRSRPLVKISWDGTRCKSVINSVALLAFDRTGVPFCQPCGLSCDFCEFYSNFCQIFLLLDAVQQGLFSWWNEGLSFCSSRTCMKCRFRFLHVV